MSRTHQATLTLRRGRGKIVIDGKDLAAAVGSLELRADARSIPHLQLTMSLLDIHVDGELTVSVPEHTRKALVGLGWTPPEGES